MPSPEALVSTNVQELTEIGKTIWQVSVCCGIPFIVAFSPYIKRIIGMRDRWRCQQPGCDRTDKDGWFLQAAHYDHDRSNPHYDTPDNGRMLCVEHHLQDHMMAQGKEYTIGMTRDGNDWAINKLSTTNRRKIGR